MPLWIVVALLGLVEGVTEFIPVSSTGHLLIAERLLQVMGVLGPEHWLVQASAEKDLFNIVIQSGAVLAVLPLFPDRLRQFFLHWREPGTRDYLGKIALPVVITGAVGFVLDKQGFRLPEQFLPVAIALFIGGILFLLIESLLLGRKSSGRVSWTIATAVGIAQLVAGVFPGTSRSGATILVALLLGLNRVASVEFTFLVGIPTMLGVSAWKIFKALHHPAPGALPVHWNMVLLGFIVSAAVSFLAVKWLLRFIQTHTFVVFGWYRIALAALIGLLLLKLGA